MRFSFLPSIGLELSRAALGFLVLVLVANASAATCGPEGKTAEFVQPDGTQITLKVFGDEFYALKGGDPRPTNGLFIAPESGYLTLTAQKYALAGYGGVTNATIEAFMTTNLTASWLRGTNAITTITNAAELLKVLRASPMSEAQNQFLRLEVTQP